MHSDDSDDSDDTPKSAGAAARASGGGVGRGGERRAGGRAAPAGHVTRKVKAVTAIRDIYIYIYVYIYIYIYIYNKRDQGYIYIYNKLGGHGLVVLLTAAFPQNGRRHERDEAGGWGAGFLPAKQRCAVSLLYI